MTRLARAIVLRYPAPWRERYEAEVLALLEDSPIRARDLGELVRGLMIERARALIEDADHPTRTATILSSMQPVFVIVFMAAAWGLGHGLRSRFGPPPTPQEFGTWIMFGFISAHLIGMVVFRWRRHSLTGLDSPMFPAWAGLLLLPVLFVGLVFVQWDNWAGWAPTPSSELSGFHLVLQLWIYGTIVATLSSAFWPGQRILGAIGKVAWAESQLRSAQQWVDGCHTMIAQGVPSPLAEAEALVELNSQAREKALEHLQQLGYRARFRTEHPGT